MKLASPNVIIGSKQNAAIADVFPRFQRNDFHNIEITLRFRCAGRLASRDHRADSKTR